MTKQWKFKFVGFIPFETFVHVNKGEDHDGREVIDEFDARDAAWDYVLDGPFDPKIDSWTCVHMQELEVE